MRSHHYSLFRVNNTHQQRALLGPWFVGLHVGVELLIQTALGLGHVLVQLLVEFLLAGSGASTSTATAHSPTTSPSASACTSCKQYRHQSCRITLKRFYLSVITGLSNKCDRAQALPNRKKQYSNRNHYWNGSGGTQGSDSVELISTIEGFHEMSRYRLVTPWKCGILCPSHFCRKRTDFR